jgi:hypothetical protein
VPTECVDAGDRRLHGIIKFATCRGEQKDSGKELLSQNKILNCLNLVDK